MLFPGICRSPENSWNNNLQVTRVPSLPADASTESVPQPGIHKDLDKKYIGSFSVCMTFFFSFSYFSIGMGSVRRLRKARSVCRACACVSTTCCVALCCASGSVCPTWCRTSPAPASCRLSVLELSSTTSKSVSTSTCWRDESLTNMVTGCTGFLNSAQISHLSVQTLNPWTEEEKSKPDLQMSCFDGSMGCYQSGDTFLWQIEEIKNYFIWIDEHLIYTNQLEKLSAQK